MFSQSIKKIKNSALNKNNGFTLLEMVVATGIFVLAISSILSIFVAASSAQKKSQSILAAQAEARYVLEAISRQIREGYIDYSYYSDPINPANQTTLAVRNLKDQRILFSSDSIGCASPESSPCVKMTDSASNVYNLTGKTVKVQNLTFYISPLSDPFDPDNNPAATQQPKVTITMAIQSIATAPEHQVTAFVQTTVSTRFYGR